MSDRKMHLAVGTLDNWSQCGLYGSRYRPIITTDPALVTCRACLRAAGLPMPPKPPDPRDAELARLRAEVADLTRHADAMADDKTHYCRLVDLYECPCDDPRDCPVAAYRRAHPLPPSGAGPDSMPGEEPR